MSIDKEKLANDKRLPRAIRDKKFIALVKGIGFAIEQHMRDHVRSFSHPDENGGVEYDKCWDADGIIANALESALEEIDPDLFELVKRIQQQEFGIDLGVS